jgi:hypothetical protein
MGKTYTIYVMKLKQLFLSIITSFVLLGIFTPTAYAFCRSFWNPNQQFDMEGAMKVFVHYADAIESVIVQPAYKGTVKDFALVFATPNRPKVTDAPKGLFENLDSMTNPWVPVPIPIDCPNCAILTATAVEKSPVTVHEIATAGDYTATILSATSGAALADYLKNNGYPVTPKDIDVFNHYVAKGNWYFTALKIDVSKITPNGDGKIDGLLSPIQMTFASDHAMLPMKLLAGDMGTVKLLVYTLSQNGLFIPGVDVQYAKKLTQSSPKVTESFDWNAWTKINEVIYEPIATILSRFTPSGNWLVRMGFDVDTKSIISDLSFAENIPGPISVQNGTPKRFMPDQLPKLAGILPGTGEISTGDRYLPFFTSSQKLTYGSRGTQVLLLQELLNQVMKPAVPIIADGKWGRKTADLVRQFQIQFGIKIDGIVGKQTRTFMQSLIQK